MGRQRGRRAQQRPGSHHQSHRDIAGAGRTRGYHAIEALQDYPEHAGGIWALVHLDLEKLDSKPERINISLPRFVLSKIDRYAAVRHKTRSGFLSRAALSLIEAEAKGGGAR